MVTLLTENQTLLSKKFHPRFIKKKALEWFMWMKEGKSASDDLDGGQKEGFSYKDYSNIHEKITLV